MKTIFLLLLILTVPIYSQWVQQPLPSDLNMALSVDFTNVSSGITCGWKTGFTGKAAYTTNSGATWQLAQVPDSSRSLVSVQMLNSLTGFIGGAYNKTGVTVTGMPEKLYLNSNAVSSKMGLADENYEGDINYKGLFLKTTNGGLNWSTFGILPDSVFYIVGMKFPDLNTGFACANMGAGLSKSGILKTTNGGVSWGIMYISDTLEVKQIFTTDGMNIYVTARTGTPGLGSKGYVLQSSNGGVNWNIRMLNQTAETNGISFVNSTTGFISGWSTELRGMILKTTNSGTNWQTSIVLGFDSYLSSLSFLPGTGTGISFGYRDNLDSLLIIQTTDYGSTWSKFCPSASPNLFNASDMVDAANWYICGGANSGTMYRTTNGGISFIETVSSEIPTEFSLEQNYPNPFNPMTNIKFEIPASVETTRRVVSLIVYNSLGKEIATLVNEEMNSGTYEVNWNALNLPSGIYFYTLRSGSFTRMHKMVLLK
jgi:photosystem II stability/assembly factor-like uncharacterized protein